GPSVAGRPSTPSMVIRASVPVARRTSSTVMVVVGWVRCIVTPLWAATEDRGYRVPCAGSDGRPRCGRSGAAQRLGERAVGELDLPRPGALLLQRRPYGVLVDDLGWAPGQLALGGGREEVLLRDVVALGERAHRAPHRLQPLGRCRVLPRPGAGRRRGGSCSGGRDSARSTAAHQ